MDISIIICTCNRCHNLLPLLISLENLLIPKECEWEVVIIDNNSNDRTKDIINDFKQRGTIPLNYFFEGKQGKSHALNLGINKATGVILAFTDDDCILDSLWLTNILKEFRSDALLFGVGGRVELYNKNDKPVTIRTMKKKTTFSSVDQLFTIIAGCNMAFKKNVFDLAGGFDTCLGPGTKTLSAEDADILYRLFKKGLKIIYSPDILIYHNHGRKLESEVQALNKSYVIGRGAFYCKHILNGDTDIFKMAYYESKCLALGLIKNLFTGKSVRLNRRYLRALLVGAIYNLRASY